MHPEPDITAIYLAYEGRRLGPVRTETLDELVHAGAGRAELYLWRSGMAEWAVLSGPEGVGAPAGSTQWYFLLGQTSVGPLSQLTLDELVSVGLIGHGTPVWRHPMPAWRPAGEALPGFRRIESEPVFPADALGFRPDPPADARIARLMHRASFVVLSLLLALTVLGLLFG